MVPSLPSITNRLMVVTQDPTIAQATQLRASSSVWPAGHVGVRIAKLHAGDRFVWVESVLDGSYCRVLTPCGKLGVMMTGFVTGFCRDLVLRDGKPALLLGSSPSLASPPPPCSWDTGLGNLGSGGVP